MEALGLVIMLIGAVIAVIGYLWLLLIAARISKAWFVGSMLIPFVFFVFLYVKWFGVKKPFFIYLSGVLLLSAGFALGNLG